MSVQILHGPGLRAVRPSPGIKRQPCTWTISARMQPLEVDAIERLARLHNCKKGDIIRTAVVQFLSQNAPAPTVDTLQDQVPPPAALQPRTAKPYTGNGGSDQNTIRASQASTAARKANGNVGERLVDKATAR